MNPLVLALSLSLFAADEGRRVGIFVGSNAAPEGRQQLEHAQTDAERVRRVFVELGSIAPEDAIILKGASADQIADAISRVGPGASMLVFYYSGHADDRALLLGESELSLVELNRALAEAKPKLGLHLVDACRSGALTRRKGAALGERFSVSSQPFGEGRVVITSSAEWEDSQESDRLGGSFFTLHLASGLRGAADDNSDGRITLEEAYRYVYGRTVESTVGTTAGTQHPTYLHDLSGRGDIILTWTERTGGTLVLGSGDYLIIDESRGHIVAELAPSEKTAITLAPGSYRVRKRTRTEVWSGRTQLTAGQRTHVDTFLQDRVAHAQLVRKGGARDPNQAHGVRLSFGRRGNIDAGLPAAWLMRASYELVLPWFSLQPYVSWMPGSSFSTSRLQFRSSELSGGLALMRALDIGWLTLRGGLFGELARLKQAEANDSSLDRSTWAGAVGLKAGAEVSPLLDFLVAVSGEAAVYTYKRTDTQVLPIEQSEIATQPTYRALLTVGYVF